MMAEGIGERPASVPPYLPSLNLVKIHLNLNKSQRKNSGVFKPVLEAYHVFTSLPLQVMRHQSCQIEY